MLSHRPALPATFLAASLALGLGASAVGPNYHLPPTTMPAAWSNPLPGAATQPATSQPAAVQMTAPLEQWWTVFGDQELNSLIRRAVESNLDVKQAEARMRQARGQYGIAFAGFWPTANAGAGISRSRSPGSPSSTSNSFQAGFDAAWELDVFGGARRNIEAAQAGFEAADEDRRNTLITLMGDVAADYIQLRSLQRQLAVAHNNLQVQQHSEDITRKRIIGGQAAGLDVANAEAQVASTAASIPVLESEVRQTIYSLSILLARQPGALADELLTPAPIPLVTPNIPTGLPSDLLRRRPDIRFAERNLAAATAQIGVATAQLFPQFSLTGSLGLESEKFHSLFSLASNYWSIGPSVSWPIFDAGRIRANIAVADALRDQAYLTYQQTILTALQDVENALVAYNHELEHNRYLRQSVVANRRAVDLSTELYRRGLTEFLNVLSAQSSLFSAETALAQSDAAISTDLVALYKALGGGWDLADPKSK